MVVETGIVTTGDTYFVFVNAIGTGAIGAEFASYGLSFVDWNIRTI
jgi:hypothetical protein